MEIVRQLTSRLPWVATFYPSIQDKFQELNRSLAGPDTKPTDVIYLTREAVEEIAYSALTPLHVAINFLSIIDIADQMLRENVPPYRIVYVLNIGGLTVRSI